MDVLAGCAMGTLVGLLIGLSTSPVVSSTVSALLALLVTFAGLGGSPGPLAAAATAHRLAAFSTFAVLALICGIAMRANQWLAPSLSQEFETWRTVARSATTTPDRQALAYVAYERLGIVPAGQTTATRTAGPNSVSLFAATSEGDCGMLAGKFPTERDRLKAISDLGGAWANLAAGANSLNDQQLGAFDKALLKLACNR
jgi:hypothetical protein